MPQFMNSLLQNSELNREKVGKITRPVRHDLNQIACEYTVGGANRLKVSYLIDRVPE